VAKFNCWRVVLPGSVGGVLLFLLSGCGVLPERSNVASLRPPIVDRANPAPLEARVESPPTRGAIAMAPGSLRAYRLHAAEHHPGLRAFYYEWQAQTQRAPQVRALPEPRFTYSEYLRSVETRAGPQERSFALSQSFPWFGTLRLKGSIEEKKAAALWQRFRAHQLALDHRVRTTYADYFYLGRSVAVTRENLDLLSRLERVAREKFAAGGENHPDVIRLQVEIGGVEDRLESLLDMRKPLEARFNALMNQARETPLPWPDSLPEASGRPDEEEISRWVREHNPELAALQHEIEAAELRRDLAAKESFPDFSLGVQTISTGSAIAPNTRDSGEDPWMVSVSVEIPLWVSKYRAAEREAKAGWQAARARRTEVSNRVVADVELALYQIRDAERRIELYGRRLVRKAQEALASTEASFQADLSSFTDLIDAERVLLEFQLSLEKARADRLRGEADLDRQLGRYVVPPGDVPREDASSYDAPRDREETR